MPLNCLMNERRFKYLWCLMSQFVKRIILKVLVVLIMLPDCDLRTLLFSFVVLSLLLPYLSVYSIV